MKLALTKIRQYLPDYTVLDERPEWDADLSQPLFFKGGEVGCITLHGIGGTPANIRCVADALIAQGYTVVSPTLPGHGETVRALGASTDAQWLQCIFDAYDRLRREGCTRIYALGLSLGGILSSILAEERPLCGLVLLCAPVKMQRYLRFSRRISGLIPVIRYPEPKNPENSARHNPYAQMYTGFCSAKLNDLNRLCLRLRRNLTRIQCPTLFFTAEYDDKVDPVSVGIFQKGAVHVPSFTHVHLAHSPHGCTYGCEREDVAARCVDFVRRQEAALAEASAAGKPQQPNA